MSPSSGLQGQAPCRHRPDQGGVARLEEMIRQPVQFVAGVVFQARYGLLAAGWVSVTKLNVPNKVTGSRKIASPMLCGFRLEGRFASRVGPAP